MKRVLFVLAAMLLTLSAGAQKIVEGSVPSLKGETKINFKVDYSETKIENMSIEDWLDYRQTEQPDYNAADELEKELKPTLQSEIVGALNKKLQKKGVTLTTKGTAKYTLVVSPISITKKGKNRNLCSLVDANGKTLVKFEVSGRGGTFGSMDNLWGDGYENSGKTIASFVAQCFR